jgi:hypothetical protein
MLETLLRYSGALFQLCFDWLDKRDILCQLYCAVCSSACGPVVVVHGCDGRQQNSGTLEIVCNMHGLVSTSIPLVLLSPCTKCVIFNERTPSCFCFFVSDGDKSHQMAPIPSHMTCW